MVNFPLTNTKKTRLNIRTQRTSQLRLHILSKNSRSAQGKGEKFRSVIWVSVLQTHQKPISFMHTVLVGALQGKRTTWKKRRRWRSGYGQVAVSCKLRMNFGIPQNARNFLPSWQATPMVTGRLMENPHASANVCVSSPRPALHWCRVLPLAVSTCQWHHLPHSHFSARQRMDGRKLTASKPDLQSLRAKIAVRRIENMRTGDHPT